MAFYIFDWTDEIIGHLAEHDVTPEEFEDVLTDPDKVEPSRSSCRMVAFGWTQTGRYLCCVYELHDDDLVCEPVTAYELEA